MQLDVGETEPVDLVLKKFKRNVNSTGLVREVRLSCSLTLLTHFSMSASP